MSKHYRRDMLAEDYIRAEFPNAMELTHSHSFKRGYDAAAKDAEKLAETARSAVVDFLWITNKVPMNEHQQIRLGDAISALHDAVNEYAHASPKQSEGNNE